MKRVYNILFLCTGNACRSQMAEGFAKYYADRAPAFPIGVSSAGIESHGINSMAVQVMREAGVDITSQSSKIMHPESLATADLVVTLCSDADKNCPVLPPHVERVHWPLKDPARAIGTEGSRLKLFRESRDDIRARVAELVSGLLLAHLGQITSFGADDVRVLRRDSLYQGFFELQKFTLQHRLFAGGWSDELQRELFVRGQAVAVLPYDPETGELALIEQFRIGAIDENESAWLLELVAGMVEVGETPEVVALRECQEEIGVEPYQLIPMFNYLVSPGGTNERIHLYLGLTNVEQAAGLHGVQAGGEDIRVTRLSLAMARAAMVAGRINNAATIMALQWLLLNKEQVGAPV